ncbi:MAG: cellulose biosynthesis protein BcsD [Novosphingobium sp.]|nr:cellulose biosynthesis protein BcsD [Novosphingobium sp.]
MELFANSPKRLDENGFGGLVLVALSAASEVCEAVPALQAHGFFVAIGKRIAALDPLEGIHDASALSMRLNAFWAALDWGQMELELNDDAIVVRHDGLPLHIAPDPRGHWAALLSGVLEGAYDSWFRALGSGPALKTRAEWKGEALELRHGR